MKAFLYRLIPPRKSFLTDITDAEAKLMQEHGQYWRGLMTQGAVVVFGPVADPAGPYGIAVIEQPEQAQALALASADPAVLAGVGFDFELHLMPQCITRE